ncbi:MAG: urease accessory protein UreD [Phormidesmis sp.]
MAYPLSVSPVFRLEEDGTASSTNRAYLYRMNTSPGLLAGDALEISLQLDKGSQLYLIDQAATKVHTMTEATAQARVSYQIDVGTDASLEFLPEPLILFAGSTLTQKTDITLHSTAGLSWGEIVLPGRLARGEVYQFRQYLSRLRVQSPDGQMWFAESMKLLGKENRFSQQALFASGAVLGTLVLVLPGAIATPQNLSALSIEIEALAKGSVDLASSVLPGDRGLFIRAMANTTREMQACFRQAVNCVRILQGQALLPYSL